MRDDQSGNSFPHQGYLYIVCGKRKYFEEACVSVRSLKSADPEAHATLVSDVDFGREDCFDRVVIDQAANEGPEVSWRKGLLFKTRHIYTSSPYAMTFFVDSDTYFVDNCRCLFDVLEYYDLSLAHGTNDRNKVQVGEKTLEALTPYNTGVILFRRSERNRLFFENWHSCYERQIDVHPHDQPAFVETLSLSSCRTYILQNNWNARFIFPEKYAGKVMILHGRHEDLPGIAGKINYSHLPRLWCPQVEKCLYPEMDTPTAWNFMSYLLTHIAKKMKITRRK